MVRFFITKQVVLTFALTVISAFCFGQPDDYIAYYPFTGNANDASGNGLDGSVSSANIHPANDRDGQPNAAFSFPGTTGEFIGLGNKDLFSASNQVAIAGWINPQPGGFAVQSIFYCDQVRLLYRDDLKSLEFQIFSGVSGFSLGTDVQSIPANQWSYIVCTYDGVAGKIYLNCNLIHSFNIPNVDINMPASEVYIGSGGVNNSFFLNFTGFMDEIKIYDRGLSEAEVNSLISAEQGGGSQTDILSFSIPQQTQAAVIDPQAKMVTLEVPCQTDRTDLTASFQLSPQATASASGVLQQSGISDLNYLQPVTFTISNGPCASASWVVKVERKQSDEPGNTENTRFQNFNLSQQTRPAVIDVNHHRIDVEVFCDTDLTNLSPSFSLKAGSVANVNNVRQNSGVAKNNFTGPVIYVVTNDAMCSQSEWEVVVTKEILPDVVIDELTLLRSFDLPQQMSEPVIEDHTISIEVPCSTDLTRIIPTFLLYTPTSRSFISSSEQISGSTAQNFEHPVTYRITDERQCYSREWIVRVNKPMIEIHIADSIPNVVTANSDDKNDFFELPDIYSGSALKIINRYGKEIYFNTNYQNDFSGSDLSPGVYFYTLTSSCFRSPLMGPLTIMK